MADEQREWKWADQRTPAGHPVDEAASALQKCLRRGLEREALYFAAELATAGFDGYVFRRLRIVASEDVGLADPLTVILVRELYENFAVAKKAKKTGDCWLFLTHATMALSRARKSRIVDDACNVFYAGDRAAMRITVPDFAVDHHTQRGRSLGRSEASVYDESYRLHNEPDDLPNEYHDETRAIDDAPPRVADA